MRIVRLFLLFLSTQVCVCLHALGAEVTLETLHGREVSPYLVKLAELRMAFFRDYPYLYEGNFTCEAVYVCMYGDSNDSIFVVAKNGEEVVGIASGLPLLESQKENRRLFEEKQIPAETVFYLGEIVVSQKYQQDDLQQRLYEQLEKDVIETGLYNTISVCEIQRTPQDSKHTLSMNSPEIFWENRGFIKQRELDTFYSWQDIGDRQETEHLMSFWIKSL